MNYDSDLLDKLNNLIHINFSHPRLVFLLLAR